MSAGTADLVHVGSIRKNLTEAIEPVLARNSHIVECQASIVNAIESELGTKISDTTSSKKFLCSVISDRYNERVHSMIMIVNEQSGEKGTHLTITENVTWPVLLGIVGGGVNNEFLLLAIVCGCG